VGRPASLSLSIHTQPVLMFSVVDNVAGWRSWPSLREEAAVWETLTYQASGGQEFGRKCPGSQVLFTSSMESACGVGCLGESWEKVILRAALLTMSTRAQWLAWNAAPPRETVHILGRQPNRPEQRPVAVKWPLAKVDCHSRLSRL
jgi:hypothetical protein